jgi:hypothetical protein
MTLRDPTRHIAAAESITPLEPNGRDHASARNFASANRGTAGTAPVHTRCPRAESFRSSTHICRGLPHLLRHRVRLRV